MTNPQVPPEQDIGPFYRAAGVIALLAFIAVIVIQTLRNHETTKLDLIQDGITVLVIFGLLRPKFVDNISKSVADFLPFFKFTKQ